MPVVLTPSDRDLTTLAAVREFMQVPDGETEQDAVTQTVITSMSIAAMRHCQREFAPVTAAAARDFEFDLGNGILDLAPYDLRTLTSVDVGPALADLEALNLAYVRPYPMPARDGVYTGLRVTGTYPSLWARWPSVIVRVTGAWGFSSVPLDVQQALTLAVAIWLRRDVANFTTTLRLDTERLERPEAIPSAARALLETYRRRTFK